jgi:uncharacterized membrane protein YkvA (DUF1232 family)
MRVVIDLSENDLEHFRAAMRRAREAAQHVSTDDIIVAARKLLSETQTIAVPDFVAERMRKLEFMIQMSQDIDWHITDAERLEVLSALTYFCDPEDAIPDQIPVLGFLDDAIMIELVVEELKHELDAYEDFCAYRLSPQADFDGDGKVDRAEWLSVRELELLERMRRRRGRDASYGGARRSLFNNL